MAKLLFDYGAKPNEEQSSEAPGGNTAWHALLKAMASEMPKPKPKRSSTADTASLTSEEEEGQAEAKRKKLQADQARRNRLADLAVLFLQRGANSYATVRAMPPEPPQEDEPAPSTLEKPPFIVRVAKSVGTHVQKDVSAAVTAVGNVPTRLGNAHTQLKETWALTRDVDSAKLTLDQIVQAVWRRGEDAAYEQPSTAEDMMKGEEILQALVDRRKEEKKGNAEIFLERFWQRVKLFVR